MTKCSGSGGVSGMQADLSFEATFESLARHFFPDGCPVSVGPGSQSREALYVQRMWPYATSRAAVPPSAALESMANLRRYAESNGMRGPEMVAIGYVASMATLPAVVTSDPHRALQPIRSALLDGTTEHFCSLVQCLLPRFSNDASTSDVDEDYCSCMIVARQLVSSCCGGLRDVGQDDIVKARRCVLQFLHLLVKWSRRPIRWSESSRHVLTAIYQWALHRPTTTDALRVIWFSERDVPAYRVRQLQSLLDRLKGEEQKSHSIEATLAMYALADVLMRYDKSAARSKPYRTEKWLDLTNKRAAFPCAQFLSLRDGSEEMDRAMRKTLRFSEFYRNRSLSNKRLRPQRNAIDVESVVSLIRGILYTNNTSDTQVAEICRSLYVFSSASELLEDTSIEYAHCLCLQSNRRSFVHTAAGTIFQQRLFSVLEHLLSEQWNQRSQRNNGSAINASSRLMLLQSMYEHGQVTLMLPEVAEGFFLQHILSAWNGADEGEFGRTLLAIIPFICPPQSCQSLKKLIENGQKAIGAGQVFCHLERLFLNGSNLLRYAIVSEALAGLVYRWGVVFDKPSHDNEQSQTQWKSDLLVEICQWTERLLRPEAPHIASLRCNEFWFAAVIEFYQSVVDLYHEATEVPLQLVVPSPAIVSRLWLTSSVVHLDLLCKLLLQYNVLVKKWKDINELDDDSATKTRANVRRVEAYEQSVLDFSRIVWLGCTSTDRDNSVTKTRLRDVHLHHAGLSHRLEGDSAPGIHVTTGKVYESDSCKINYPLYLEYLESHGLLGIHGLLSKFDDQTADDTGNVEDGKFWMLLETREP